MDSTTQLAEQDTSGSAKFVMHKPCLTPTERASRDHRKRLLASIEARAEARKPQPPLVMKSRDDVAFGPVVSCPLSLDDVAFGPVVHEPVDQEEQQRSNLPPVEAIIAATAKYFGVTRNEIKSGRRDVALVRPRQVAIFMALRLTRRSLPDIGRRMGGRDHTTCLHADRRIFGDILRGNRNVIAAVDALFEKFGGIPTH